MTPALLTVEEAAERLRGTRSRDAREFVRGLILDGRLSAIKQRGRWYIQARSIDDLATPRIADAAPPRFPRRVEVRRSRVA